MPENPIFVATETESPDAVMTADRPRILLIDDDPLFRNMVVTLVSEKYQVETAADGPEGFQHALENPPDVVAIDVRMPGWNGLETLKAFRDHPALEDVKIVMLTADATRTTVLDAVNSGADDYVIKTSFTKNEFIETVERLLEAPPSPAKEEYSTGMFAEEEYEIDLTGGAPESAAEEVEKPTPRRRQKPTADLSLQELIDSWE